MTSTEPEADGCSHAPPDTAPTLADAELTNMRQQAVAALASSQRLAAAALQLPCSRLPVRGLSGHVAGAAASLVILLRMNERLREAITETPPPSVTLEAVLAHLKTIDDEC